MGHLKKHYKKGILRTFEIRVKKIYFLKAYYKNS